MSSSEGSTKVIVIAFFANLGIAAAKFIGAFLSGSASLLAEAIHSLVDCSNQIFLLIGSKKSLKPADDKHPLGYGRESFFWSFIVAIFLFSLGGLFAIYEGAHKLHDGGELSSPIIGLSILVFGIILESYSFWACYKEVRNQNTYGSLWQWFKKTKSSELLVIFTEDAAALAGLILAAVCLSIAWVTGDMFWDAMGSILIGIILVIVAALLAVEVKGFIIGESSSDAFKDFYEKKVISLFPGGRILRLITLQTGSSEVMLSCKLDPGSMLDLNEAIKKVNQMELEAKAQFPDLRWQFIELDRTDN